MRLSRVSILLCVLAYPASRLMFPLMSSTIKCYFNQAQKYWVKKSSQNFDLSTIWSTYVDRNFEIFHFITMNWFFAQYLKQQCSKCYTWSLHICLLISLYIIYEGVGGSYGWCKYRRFSFYFCPTVAWPFQEDWKRKKNVKSSQVVGLRDRVAIIRALLHAISYPQPYAGYGDLSGVGRRRNLSEARRPVP